MPRQINGKSRSTRKTGDADNCEKRDQEGRPAWESYGTKEARVMNQLQWTRTSCLVLAMAGLE